MDTVKARFYSLLDESVRTKKGNNFYLSKERYAAVIAEVKEAKRVAVKQTVHYRRLRRYDVLKIGGEEKLIAPVTENGEEILYYVCYDSLFDILYETHNSVGHGGRTRMTKELARKYKNVTIEAIVTYLRLCESCQKKQKITKSGAVVKPILHSEMNSRCQIDLIDMQANPDGGMKFILVYQDHLTKFVLLKALSQKTANAIAHSLVDIFSIFGAPNILHSDNGREFCNETLNSLCRLWDGVKLVHGKPRHSQSQGSVERANQDIENMLSTWMETNRTASWTEGLRFVQAMKNRAYHEGIKCSPYEAMFGAPMKLGITSLAGLREVFNDLQSEEDLESAMGLSSIAEESEGAEDETNGTEDDDDEEDEDGQTSDSDGSTEDDRTERPAGTSTSNVTTRSDNMERFRKSARAGLEAQAKKMLDASAKKFKSPDVGCNVTVKIPEVDRSKVDPKSMIAVVTAITDEGCYELGTRFGKLNALYTINQFRLCKEAFLRVDEVPEKTISLRGLVKKLSLVGGQGFKKCNCLQKCVTKRCLCKASKLKCNSRCHNSQPCHNK